MTNLDYNELVDNAPILRLSHSQIGTWDRCRFNWDLSYRQGWKKKEVAVHLNLGNLVHDLLSVGYKGEDWKARAKEIIKDGENDIQTISRAMWLVGRYFEDFAKYEDRGWEVVLVEHYFEQKLVSPKGRPFILIGYIDLVVRIRGKLWLVEHKTVGNSKFWTQYECLMDNQTPTYSAMLRREGLDIFGIIYNQLNTYEYKKPGEVEASKLFRREQTYRTPVELDSMLTELGKAADDIYDNRNDIRRSLKRDCERCWMVEPCLMSMKGMDIEQILQANYERKGNAIIQEEDQNGIISL